MSERNIDSEVKYSGRADRSKVKSGVGIRILFLSDTHIGFDTPRRPRVIRRRRGGDFLDNFRRALEPAKRGEVDVVVHGGDLQFRSKVPPGLTAMALEPLFEVASSGIPVFVVPGNHERSVIHQTLFEQHELLRIFDSPETFALDIRGTRVAIAGFPFVREGIEERFSGLLDETGLRGSKADFRVLCMHQSVEGATVGPVDFMFRRHRDVVRHSDIPRWVDLVLGGHIHRAQVLTRYPGGSGREDAVPVLYPGSVERKSFAETFEPKGYMLVDLARERRGGSGSATGSKSVKGKTVSWRFVELPSRPMFIVEYDSALPRSGPSGRVAHLAAEIVTEISRLPEDAVVRVILRQPPIPHSPASLPSTTSASLPSTTAGPPPSTAIDAPPEYGPGSRAPARRGAPFQDSANPPDMPNLSKIVREMAPSTMTIEIRFRRTGSGERK